MENKNPFLRIIGFLGGGVAAGFLSLVVSAVVSIFFYSEEGYFPIFVLVLVEEFVKFAGLKTLLKSSHVKSTSFLSLVVLKALPFGVGFGIFELALISLGADSVPLQALTIVIVHITTSIFLVFSVFFLKVPKKESLAYILILLAVLIHMWYNTSATSIAA